MRLTDMPDGIYSGRVLGLFRPLNLIWTGKKFTALRGRVLNRVFGHWLIEGTVLRRGGMVVISYPRLGLKDYLSPRSDGGYDGSMRLGPVVVYFTLTKENS